MLAAPRAWIPLPSLVPSGSPSRFPEAWFAAHFDLKSAGGDSGNRTRDRGFADRPCGVCQCPLTWPGDRGPERRVHRRLPMCPQVAVNGSCQVTDRCLQARGTAAPMRTDNWGARATRGPTVDSFGLRASPRSASCWRVTGWAIRPSGAPTGAGVPLGSRPRCDEGDESAPPAFGLCRPWQSRSTP